MVRRGRTGSGSGSKRKTIDRHSQEPAECWDSGKSLEQDGAQGESGGAFVDEWTSRTKLSRTAKRAQALDFSQSTAFEEQLRIRGAAKLSSFTHDGRR